MRTLLAAAALLLSACAATQPCCQASQHYVFLSFAHGEVKIRLYQTAAAEWFYQLVQNGYYDGAPIYRDIPGKAVAFGEGYWAGKTTPKVVISNQGQPTAQQGIAPGRVALAVLAQPTSQTTTIGAQVVVATTSTRNMGLGFKLLPIGTMLPPYTTVATLKKGDKLLSADPAQPVANPQ